MSETISHTQIDRMLKNLYYAAGAPYFFDEPLTAVAAADDPWFLKFKTIIGNHHWTPDEALHFVSPNAKAKSVFIWALPVNQKVREANRMQKDGPAGAWAAMRSFGEKCNENMRYQLCRLLNAAGYAAVAPHLEQVKQGLDIYGMGFTSHWSERHVAFVAGLGTFGLSAGLITERGIAMRLGSIVTLKVV